MSYGHRYTLVMASLTKRCLQGKLPAEMRLEFLQHLEKMTDTWLTPEVIAIVEPMEAKGIELSEEARKLGWKGRPNALDVFAQKFDVFAALNPSLQRAYDAAFAKYERPF
ncbi:hypothetical protein IVA98_32945 [Bradyrhizobium sp. 160]|uniref:hypothetical protein n=1 Tax=Bradyrhizobium sp. 160 TaxID=2782634 RepID=UPI001FFB1ACF|nr:hypothetical protein [Bradyrhizobium sp. 160]MCK1627837.1 hypothetical protein [Bradyrhizobium sp. 160]